MKFGLALKPPFSVQEVLEASTIADQKQVDFIMIDDEPPGPDVWTVLGAIARVTKKAKLGPSITNAYSRHPLISVLAALTLHELSRDRAILGIASGAPRIIRSMGYNYAKHIEKLEEALIICKNAIKNGHVKFKGNYYGDIDFRIPSKPNTPLPIWGGGLGQKAIATAIRYCDAFLGTYYPSENYISYINDTIDAAVDDCGRSRDEVELGMWVPAFFAIDGKNDVARRAQQYAEFRLKILTPFMRRLLELEKASDIPHLYKKMVLYGDQEEIAEHIGILKSNGIDFLLFALPLVEEPLIQKISSVAKLKKGYRP